MTNEPIEQIREGNPWYIADQIVASQSREQRLIIANRIRFIVEILTEWSKNKELPLKLLDAGCGDGVLLKVLASLEDFKVYGIDYNPVRVGRAKKNAPQATVKQSDLRAIEFKDSFFDAVILSHVLEHIPEDVLVLKTLARILKKNGILILGVPNEGCFLAHIRNKYIEPYISRTTDHVNFYTEKIVIKKLTEAGFNVVKIMREGFFSPHQMLNTWLSGRYWGYRLMQVLGKVIVSQAAGFYLVCKKLI